MSLYPSLCALNISQVLAQVQHNRVANTEYVCPWIFILEKRCQVWDRVLELWLVCHPFSSKCQVCQGGTKTHSPLEGERHPQNALSGAWGKFLPSSSATEPPKAFHETIQNA